MTALPHITDHALLRFIERYHGISLDPLRQQLIDIVSPASAIGATNFIHNDFTFCFSRSSNGQAIVATILEPGMKSNARKAIR